MIEGCLTLLATPITEPPKTCESTDCKGAGCVELSIEFWPPRPGCSAADWPGWGRLCCEFCAPSPVVPSCDPPFRFGFTCPKSWPAKPATLPGSCPAHAAPTA